MENLKVGTTKIGTVVATNSNGVDSTLKISSLRALVSNSETVCSVIPSEDNFVITGVSAGTASIIAEFFNEDGILLSATLEVTVDVTAKIVSIKFVIQ